ncbi:MAG: M20 family metallopeptidase [Candidatus Thorarchaeota archaeon]
MIFRDLKHQIIDEARDLEEYIVQTRRYLHMHPETAYEEHKTADYIENELKNLGFDTERTAGTGILGILNNDSQGKTVALRADIDALNITEENDIPYRSKIPGKMHACGHDAHTAMLLGAAKILFKYREILPGPLKLIFQPGEEGKAGAKKIVEEGQLDDVDAIFGLHVWQASSSGEIATRTDGALFASSDRFTIIVSGIGGHAAMPHETIDPIPVLFDIYNALQKVISREIDPFEPVVLTIPRIVGSNAHNIIPTVGILNGTLRTLNPKVRSRILDRLQEVVVGYSQAWRCKGLVNIDPLGYPALINDKYTTKKIITILHDLDEVKPAPSSMIGEDFGFYLQRTKGVFFTLGIYNEETGIIHPHHHPQFQVDESVLWKGTAIYAISGLYYYFS